MILKYKVTNLCCANCAAKIERSINKLKGVKEANLSFMSLKLTVDAEEDVNAEDLERQISKIVTKIEKNSTVEKI
ncbi:MAG: heavy-metal-associated domain-containing protein [Ruminococcaceae bacterium]|nr:heavy-metal-associated domain-containing protein [Oscillospiraceae bacterium]